MAPVGICVCPFMCTNFGTRLILTTHSYVTMHTCECVFKNVLWLAKSLHLPPDMNHLDPTCAELNELPSLPHLTPPLTSLLTLNHISLSDMGTPGQTHTPSFSLCLSTQINSHSSRALSCLKLHLWIIDHLVPPKTPAWNNEDQGKESRESRMRERQEGGTEEESWPSPQHKTKPKHLFCQGLRLLYGITAGFLLLVDCYCFSYNKPVSCLVFNQLGKGWNCQHSIILLMHNFMG